MRSWLLLPLMFVASCSQPEQERRSDDLKTFDAGEPPPNYTTSASPAPVAPPPPPGSVQERMASADTAGPNISVSAAPGVAFNYRYAYRLPNARISVAQEAHAAMCEKLGVA